VSERPTVLLDVDGTLVDSNYQHAIAWHRAFHEHGYRAAIWEIHRHVGMGGDQFVGALLGEEAEDADGDELRDAHSDRSSPAASARPSCARSAPPRSHSIAALREHGVEWVLGLAGTSAS
jgi:phosphoglycolate phosphatase-like HAD superfamily hydrolase